MELEVTLDTHGISLRANFKRTLLISYYLFPISYFLYNLEDSTFPYDKTSMDKEFFVIFIY